MNVLITADIHIGEYDLGFTPNSRIDQFYKLSQRYIEIAKETGSEELWILGDFLKIPNNKAYVQHILKEFLKPLSDHFKKVRYILGNHDLNNKSDNQSIRDTIITLFDFPNFEYMDKKYLYLDGKFIGFMNWYPSQNLDWIEDKLDVLCGHYTKSSLFGQEIDESKFDLMIHGDIHNDQVIGKFVSVNTPFQHDMRCIEKGSVILLETDTLQWRRIETDPDHTRFLRIKTVTDSLLEGFESPLQYNKYQPIIARNEDGVSIDVPQWKDISDLIDSLIKINNFQVIHDEIKSKCIDYSEIDFNFQLKSIKIQGFRSIVNFELNFDGTDRVILLGKNGSGKSSIIRSLKAIFEKCRYMKDERSEFTDLVLVTLSLFYQNKFFEITKGDSYELKIDGVTQTYNNQTQFENDVIERLPFFEYSDLFFITSDIQNLSSKFTPDRRIELISKFYRLDRIDAYSKTAYQLNQDMIELAEPIKVDLIKAKGAMETIQIRLEELKEFAEIDINELRKIADSYVKLRDDYNHYQIWKSNYEKLVVRKEELERTLKTYETKLNPEHGIEYITTRIETLNSKISQIEAFEVDFNKRWRRLTEIIPIKTQLYDKGIELNKQVESLRQKRCLFCGSNLSDGIAGQKINELEDQKEDVKKNYIPIYEEYISYSEAERSPKYFENESKKLKSELSSNKDELNIFATKKTQYDIAKEHFDLESKNLNTIKIEISNHESKKPEEIKLPMNLSELESDIRSKITNYENYKNEIKKRVDKLQEIDELTFKIEELQSKSDCYTKYAQFMSRTGNVYEEVLRKLADLFSESDFKYEVEAWESRGRKNLAFNSFYKVKNKYRIYERLSDGQKTVCDLDFLNKLFSVRVGILILDEHLKHLDEDNLQKASEILSKMNVNSLMISTHDTNYSQYTKKVLLDLSPEGHTEYQIY